MGLKDRALRILELAEKATLGPWDKFIWWHCTDDGQDEAHACGPIHHGTPYQLRSSGRVLPRSKEADSDAEFIAESRTTAPELAKAYLRMREALEFYADENIWRTAIEEYGGSMNSLPRMLMDDDRGQRARECLEGLK